MTGWVGRARRCGANPSPRSWLTSAHISEEARRCGAFPLHEAGPAFALANALGGLAKRGRVRCGTLLHGKRMRRRRTGARCRWSPRGSCPLRNRSATGRTSPGISSKCHPEHLQEQMRGQLRGEGLASHRRASSEMCADVSQLRGEGSRRTVPPLLKNPPPPPSSLPPCDKAPHPARNARRRHRENGW